MTNLPFDPSLMEPPGTLPITAPSTVAPAVASPGAPGLPPLPTRSSQVTALDALSIGLSTAGDIAGTLSGAPTNTLGAALIGIKSRQNEAVEQRKAQIEELKYQQSLMKSMREQQQAFPVTLGNANKEVKELAGLAFGQTPERQAALRNSAKAIYAKAGLIFMDSLVDPLFDAKNGADVLQAFEDLAPHVSLGRGMSIIAAAHRDTTKAGGVETVEKNMIDAATPKIHQDVRGILADAKATVDLAKGKLNYEGARAIIARQQGPEAPGLLKYFDGAYGKTELAKGLRAELDKWLTQQGVETPDTATKRAEAKATTEGTKAAEPEKQSLELDKLRQDIATGKLTQENLALTGFPESVQARIKADPSYAAGARPTADQALKAINAEDAKLRERGIAVSAATGLAAEQLKQNRPLSPKERADHVDVDALLKTGDLVQPPATMTHRELAADDRWREITDKQKEVLRGTKRAEGLLNTLSSLADRVITAKTTSEAVNQLARLQSKTLLRDDPTAAQFMTTRKAFVGNFSREFGSERGVLTEGDISRMSDAMYSPFDTVDLKELKKATFSDIIDNNRRAVVDEVSGRPSAPYRTRIDQLFDKLERAIPASQMTNEQLRRARGR